MKTNFSNMHQCMWCDGPTMNPNGLGNKMYQRYGYCNRCSNVLFKPARNNHED